MNIENVNFQALCSEQKKLSEKLIYADSIDTLKSLTLVGAISTVYGGNVLFTSIIVYDIKKQTVLEKVSETSTTNMHYHTEFVSYREGPNCMKAFEKLNIKPDLFFVEGNGILHPRKMGLASHLGLLTDIPTIGISTSQVFGTRDGDAVIIHKEVVAKVLAAKDKANPIFVSPGNKITLKTALEITKKYLLGHKLPEPLHLAHKYAVKLKNAAKAKKA